MSDKQPLRVVHEVIAIVWTVSILLAISIVARLTAPLRKRSPTVDNAFDTALELTDTVVPPLRDSTVGRSEN